MNRYPIAHINKNGQNIIILHLDRQFEYLTEPQKAQFIANIQIAARQANLAGTVVPVWDSGGGRSKFIAPPQWHGYFSQLPLYAIERMKNKILTCA